MEDYNAADEKKVREQGKQNEIEREQELEDIKRILETPHGVRFFKRLFDSSYIFTSTFTGNSHTFFKEGHRNLGLIFFGDVAEAAPEKLPELMLRKI